MVRERPGLAPAALFHLIGHSVFLRLADVAAGLPPYEERVLLSSMDAEPDGNGLSQRSGHDELYGTLRAALKDALSRGSRRLLATYLQTLLAYPDGCTRGETVFDPESGDVLVQVPPLNEERLYPKERALVDLVAAERLQGRRVLVYVTHTGTRDITGRMEAFLSRHSFKVAVMKADAVPPERREAWVAKRVEEGVDVLVCHPQLVQTGLDLVDFPTVVWFETHYSVYTMRQASRRSWRIGQTEPVQVVFMAYRNTLQADALTLVAKKLQSSLAVEGELPEDGLAAFGDDGDDLMLALVRKIVAGEEEAGSVESVFEQARQVAAEAEALLVDEGWRAPEPEPAIVEAEIVAVGAAAGDSRDDAPEPQRTLFSWAEFMAGEQEEPPKRRRRDEAPTLSLFEWALDQEREGALAA
ncbi:MAG: helicase-related protein [Chloroflexota bacterium]|nr:helicase-related protein [Chloroflexota bacterium]